jgi:ribokinase
MSEGSAVTGQAGSAGLPRRSIEDLRFVVAGAFVADCFVNTPHLPAWGQTREARSIRMSPGGKALNQAVALARLGAQVSAVGVVGNDGPGRDVLAALARERVDVSWVESRDDAATTICLCFVSDEGDSGVVWHIGDDVAVTAENVEAAASAFADADAALITFEMPVPTISAAIKAASRSGARVFLQPAPPLADPAQAASLPWDQVDVFVPDEAEARALLEGGDDFPADSLATLLAEALGIPTVVVTLGAAGCVAHADGAARRYPALEALAVDTTGASDAFTATLATHLTAGASEAEAIEAAQDAAAWAIGHPGGHEAMPSASSVTPNTAIARGIVAAPPCAACGAPSARVELVPPGGLQSARTTELRAAARNPYTAAAAISGSCYMRVRPPGTDRETASLPTAPR